MPAGRRFALFAALAAILSVNTGFSSAYHVDELAARCSGLRAADLSGIEDAPTRVTRASLIAARDAVPANCRVQGYVAPQVGFEIRLPITEWNGKFLMLGCGGMCGELFTERGACDSPLQRGYACIVSDMGHRGRPDDGALWAYNNVQAEIDFAYRATHVATLAGKAIARRYYGTAPAKSYFMGCSQGGRQGLVSVQRFPWDFDGVIAGAPAIQLVSLPSLLLNYHLWESARGGEGHRVLSPSVIQRIHAAATEKCDLDDGVKDGIIGDPGACRFRPDELVCKRGSRTENCITALQAEAAAKLYAGAISSAGETLYPGAAIGSELQWIQMLERMRSGIDKSPEVDFVRYMTFVPDPGPSWEPSEYDIDRDHKRAAMMEALLFASNPDLRRFKALGGKLIVYVGWNDQGPTPASIIDYYETVERTMGGRAATQEFFRLFMLPGVNHCYGGIGADAVDFLSYLEDWVERARAPDKILSARMKQPEPGFIYPYREFPSDSTGVEFTRPVYPYPQRAVYKGSGDPDDAENFHAVEP